MSCIVCVRDSTNLLVCYCPWYILSALVVRGRENDEIFVNYCRRSDCIDIELIFVNVRLLIVDAGDIGFGLDGKTDDLLQYLGETDKLADMIIGREFLSNRGW